MKEINTVSCPRTDDEFYEYLDKHIHIYAKENNITIAKAAEFLALSCKKEENAHD